MTLGPAWSLLRTMQPIYSEEREKEKVNDMKLLKTLGKITLAIVVGLVALFALFYVLTIGDYAVAKTVAQDPSIPHITIDG